MAGIDSYSNEDRTGGSSMSNILGPNGINRSFNITGSHTGQIGSAQKATAMQSTMLSSGAPSKSSLMHHQQVDDSAESANYNDSGAAGIQNGGFVSAGRRQRPLGQKSAQAGSKSGEQRAHSRASSKNGKVGLKKNLITQGVVGPNST